MPSIDLGQEDKEWKILLQKHTPDYSDAREFWLDFYSLSTPIWMSGEWIC